jgi:hypothetical protein
MQSLTTSKTTYSQLCLQSLYTMIDGSSLEGGGQILRNSVSLAALLGKSIKIVNIRAKRDKPGIQHFLNVTNKYRFESPTFDWHSTGARYVQRIRSYRWSCQLYGNIIQVYQPNDRY